MVNLDFFFKLSKNHKFFSEFHEKSQVCSKFPENIDFGKFLFRKISMFLKVFEIVDFGQNFEKTSILVRIFENLNIGQGIGNFDFCRKILEITLLVKFKKRSSLM